MNQGAKLQVSGLAHSRLDRFEGLGRGRSIPGLVCGTSVGLHFRSRIKEFAQLQLVRHPQIPQQSAAKRPINRKKS